MRTSRPFAPGMITVVFVTIMCRKPYAWETESFIFIPPGRICGSNFGYDILAGGGMGYAYGNPGSFPRLADIIGFCFPEQVEEVARQVPGRQTIEIEGGRIQNSNRQQIHHWEVQSSPQRFGAQAQFLRLYQPAILPAGPYRLRKAASKTGG